MRIATSFLSVVAFAVASFSSLQGELASSQKAVSPLPIGETVPAVTLRDTSGADVAFADVLAEKPTVLVVYRGGWCPYCNRHLSALGEIADELIEMGFQIIAVSPDRPAKLAEAGDVPKTYTLLSDSDLALAQALGLAFRVPDETVERYKGYGIDLAGDSGRNHYGLPVPAAYVIDTGGTILFSYINPNYRIRVPGEVVLAAAKAHANGWPE